eukprot:5694734-Pyramimonas_sp.AAC.1
MIRRSSEGRKPRRWQMRSAAGVGRATSYDSGNAPAEKLSPRLVVDDCALRWAHQLGIKLDHHHNDGINII